MKAHCQKLSSVASRQSNVGDSWRPTSKFLVEVEASLSHDTIERRSREGTACGYLYVFGPWLCGVDRCIVAGSTVSGTMGESHILKITQYLR